MSRPPVYSTISDMELDVADVARWAEVVTLLGSNPHQVDPGALHVIGASLALLGERLERRWKQAFVEAGGRA